MPSIHHLLKQLSPDSNTKGKQFEKITQWFLQNEPEWQAKIEKVYYPDKWGKDLICQFKDGTHWAVQAKCYHADYALKKADIDSFLSESNRQQITGRILIATTNQLGSGAVVLIHSLPVNL
jgi:predicted helicase